MKMTLTVNGRPVAVTVDDPKMPLLYALRDELGLHGPRFGCGLAQCGACTVHVDGRAVRSCIVPIVTVEGRKVVTLEGLGTPEKPHPLQKAFVDRAGGAVRLLHQRHDHAGRRLPRDQSEAD